MADLSKITVALDTSEWQFLLTTLKGTCEILKALATLRDVMPAAFQVPIGSDTLVNIMVLSERIESQIAASS
jgi:hypothetical protein